MAEIAKADYLDSLKERQRLIDHTDAAAQVRDRQRLVDHTDADGLVKETDRPSESRSCTNEEACVFGDYVRTGGYPCCVCRHLVNGDFHINQ